ncbi:MAG: hypothetical protein WC249_02790 [Patescibacteria group bacterium]|jgi:hypothetical protein
MFDYLQKFNSLPADLRAKVSSPSVMAAISELEKKYRVDLAMTVMKVMIKGLTVKNLPAYFIGEQGLTPAAAENLTQELKQKIFFSVADYLGLSAEIKELDLDKNINLLIKEAGIILPSSALVGRFKNIIGIYLKGVRNKIDTRNTLAKNVKVGGLNLSEAEIERLLKICDSRKFSGADQGLVGSFISQAKLEIPTEKLVVKAVPEYDLKKAIDSGQIKKLEISAPDKQLDLPAVKSVLRISPDQPQDLPEAKASLKSSVVLSVTPPANKIPLITKTATTTVAKSSLAPLKPPIPAAALKSAPTLSRPAGFWSRLNIFKRKPAKPVSPVSQSSLTSSKSVSSSPRQFSPTAKTTPPILKPLSSAPKIIPPAPLPPAPRPRPSAARPTPPSSPARPQMHDIKAVPKVMGPIEELKFLDLVNFRRLGKTPAEMTAKILLKIKLLEKDGYDKMVAGVLAWRQSPVNRLYLSLGQGALNKGLFLKDYIVLRQAAGQECLSLEEVEALVSLNSKLVF